MSRRAAGNRPRDVLPFRRRSEGPARHPSKNEGRKRFEHLQRENTELRAKAIDLILQIQALREGDPNG
jgi:hypothetical protein